MAMTAPQLVAEIARQRAAYAAAAEECLRNHHANLGAVLACDRLLSVIRQTNPDAAGTEASGIHKPSK